jgi:hypothetical protein
MSNTLSFRHYSLPAEVSLSAVLPASSSRCGIYVLHFDDGLRYVGQSVSILSRFAAHRRHWGKAIVGLDFAPATAARLDALERRTIQRLERDGVALINSALVGLPMGESKLDLVVDRVEQERWLDGAAEEYDFADRLALARSRPRTGEKFARFSAHPEYDYLRIGLCVYLKLVVPWPHETERRFWSVTALPSTNRSAGHHRLSAVSINNVETLVIYEDLDSDGWQVGGFLNVSPGLVHSRAVAPNRYRTTGEVDAVVFSGWEDLVEMLDQPDVVAADGARSDAQGSRDDGEVSRRQPGRRRLRCPRFRRGAGLTDASRVGWRKPSAPVEACPDSLPGGTLRADERSPGRQS